MLKRMTVILKKCIYRLLQAAWQYYKKAIEILKSSGFKGGSIDPCLYVKRSMNSSVYVALYVDNNLMIGDKAAIDDAIMALENKGLVLKVVEGLQDYLSCEIKISENKKRAWLGQPHLIKNLKSKFIDGRCLKSQNAHYTEVFDREAYGRKGENICRRQTNLPIRCRNASVPGEAL